MANVNTSLKDLATLLNDCVEKGVFPDKLKLVDMKVKVRETLDLIFSYSIC